jgi:uncharacterized protein (DUF362 family)
MGGENMRINRREFFRNLGIAAGAAVLVGREALTAEGAAPAKTAEVIVCKGTNYKALLKRAFAKIGGLKKFVASGDRVLVKPNIAWDRKPEYAATTNPLVVAALVELCYAAGAREVKVYDNPCVDCRRSYASSGIADAARDAGAKVSYVDTALSKTIKIPNGVAVKSAKIYADFFGNDVVVNVPIAKDHSLTGLTLGMKNLMGILVENRGLWHQQINKKLVDLAQVIRPTLTVVDATRILIANGPTGGDLRYVKRLDKIVVTEDVTAADAYAATLFGLEPTDVGVVKEAKRRGFGTADLARMAVSTVKI